jgi:uncharacterized protein YabN with tetrapyrrole methylase and pyrophosphatase domain
MVLEEVCEVIDTLCDADPEKLADELGDLIIGALFLAKVADREGRFHWTAPFLKAAEKLVRRHPHIFGDAQKLTTVHAVEQRWDEIKATEREHVHRKSRFDGIPKSFPALSMWQKLVTKAHKDPSLRTTTDVLLREQGETEEEEIARRLALIVTEAQEKGIQAEPALRRFFVRCRKRLVDAEQMSAEST